MEQPTSHTRRFTVGEDDTAAAVGSGSLRVLGTPCLLAWMEAVTCEALAPSLPSGGTSVGTRVAIEHLAPSGVGQVVEVQVSVVHEDGRLRRFTVGARNVVDGAAGKVVASGEITRVVVDGAQFMAKVT
ncbi:thioesterase [Nocardioides sp. Y6]|uniref:Thioesterase n=1 Tax=Nocardioides malaquae TaxID=2773426 RepID=A0ABR9RPU4_9ACTN|nr:hotdog domain-containing protein [Nocardioides malaquae]MBE7323592.1 thioesterase [Nocardioides malaquae]